VFFIDSLGLSCSRIGPEANFALKAEGKIGVGIMGAAWIKVAGMMYDCCCDGRIVQNDSFDASLEAGVAVGLGAGVSVTLPILGTVGGMITGPNVSFTTSLAWNKECGKPSTPISWTIVDVSGNIGGSFNAGSVFGASVGYWSKYGINFVLSAGGRTASVVGNVGWKGGGTWEVVTPAVNVTGTFGNFDYQWAPSNLSVTL